MPSVRYFNQTAPFWDFVANLEDRGANHPFFAERRGEDNDGEGEGSGPWGWGPWGPFPHRGRGGQRGPHGPHGHHGPHPPPPPPGGEGPPPPPPPPAGEGPHSPPPPGAPEDSPHSGPEGHGLPRGGCRRGRGRGRGWGGWGGRGPFGYQSSLDTLAEFLQRQLNGDAEEGDENRAAQTHEDFKPEADVFDTDSSFVVHISLPGAKREDVGVNWDAERSEICVAGVVHRPGDEDFLKTLALDERKVGAFERKVRLGSRAHPAQIDADMIIAKLEDGVLRVTVPKLDKDYVEIKKVDVE